MKKATVVVVALLIVAIVAVIAGAIVFRPRLESDPPQISLSTSADTVGVAPFEVNVSDAGSGLKSLTATLTQGTTEHALAAEQFAQPAGGEEDHRRAGQGARASRKGPSRFA